MKNLVLSFTAIVLLMSCNTEKDYLVSIQTPYGEMKAILHDETPIHKENFIKLAKSGHLDSTIFHRVINGFMIQGGDLNTRPNKSPVGVYTIKGEFANQYFHRKGALAAARMGDQVNPEKESSGTQFYIVQGRTFSAEDLDALAENQRQNTIQLQFRDLLGMPEYAQVAEKVSKFQSEGAIDSIYALIKQVEPKLLELFGPAPDRSFSEEQKQAYSTIGGSPHLDRDYSVFGQVIEGLEVIDAIAAVRTGAMDKPIDPVYMIVSVKEVSRKEITKKYGYEYPAKETK